MIAIVRMVSGLMLWAFAFSALYAINGVVCCRAWSGWGLFHGDQARLVLLVTWAAFLAGHGALIVWLNRHSGAPLDRIAWAIGWIGLASTVVTGLPILTISSCV